MKVLIIGLGSIAKKHIIAIREIVPDSVIYALRSQENSNHFDDIINVYDWKIAKDVDFIIISNPTKSHEVTILKAIEFNKPLFIEKPVLESLKNADKIIKLIKDRRIPTYVAYVLRFHPIIKALKELINKASSKIDEVNVYCGSYLPDWRPNTDFRKCYSANKELGGGVHLDLTHEIDYIYWFWGNPIEVKKNIRSQSHLKINAFDYANYQLIYPDFVVNLTLNYYRKKSKRTIEILSEDFILEGDLLNYNLIDILNEKEIYKKSDQEKNLYEVQMQYFIDILDKNEFYENNIEIGIEILKISIDKL